MTQAPTNGDVMSYVTTSLPGSRMYVTRVKAETSLTAR